MRIHPIRPVRARTGAVAALAVLAAAGVAVSCAHDPGRLTAPGGALGADARSTVVRLEPSREARALGRAGAAPGPELLAAAAVVFSGVEGTEASRRTATVMTRARAVARETAPFVDPAVRAEHVLFAMHDRLLGEYSEHQTRIDVVFETGAFNCTSSAVLYLILARVAGIDVSGLKTSDHVLCRIRLPGKSVDVETTSRYGFDPGTRKEFSDHFGTVTGFASVSSKSAPGLKIVGQAELVAQILVNRVASLETRGAFVQAVGPAVDYHAVLGTPESRSFMFARISNAAADFHNSGRSVEAAALVLEVLGEYGREDSFKRVAGPVVAKRLAQLRADGGCEEGMRLLGAAGTWVDPAPAATFALDATRNGLVRAARRGDLREVRTLLADRVLAGAVGARGLAELRAYAGSVLCDAAAGSLPYAASLAVLDAPEVRSTVPVARRDDGIYLAVAREAERLSRERGSLGAWKFLRSTPATGDPRHARLVATYRDRAVLGEHEGIEKLLAAGKRAEARKAALRALALFPGEPLLLADLARAGPA